ncbi:MAG: DUF1365 domain-containing protein [Rubrivivax sp.]|nr:DUF1365 domain-containing protein [Rubrivivax sp.]
MKAPQAFILRGVVRHRRLRPAANAFQYANWCVLLPLRAMARQPLAALPRNRAGWVSFHDRDHGDGGPDALAWLEALLAREGVADAEGEIWLQTYPRLLGYVFKPVSFWYCERADGTLAAIVAEVNNTFDERHCYLLAGPELGWGQELQARKVFHVSPFCEVGGQYRFRFMRTPDRLVARIDHDDADGPLLQTSVSGQLLPLTGAALRRSFWRMPLLTLAVMARIHWQALRLWAKRVPAFPKPAPPSSLTSR